MHHALEILRLTVLVLQLLLAILRIVEGILKLANV